jgi:threonine 3-dehydrogenase
MKALVKKNPEKGLWLEEVENPIIGKEEILIKIQKTAICGTDFHIYKWDEWSQNTIKTPMVIGHEYTGVVAEKGEHVKSFKIGDRVVGEGHLICGTCRNCRRGMSHVCENTIGIGVNIDGAFAEYLKIPASNALKLNDRITDDIAALMDPFGNATHTALSFPLLGEDVLITGAGPIGCMAIAVCRHGGARHVIVSDVNDKKLDMAKKMGATRVFNPLKEDIKKIRFEEDIMHGFDVGLEMSGAPSALNLMIEEMYNGGKIALLGILPNDTKIHWDKVIFKGLELRGIYGRKMYDTWYKMEQMLYSGLDLSPVITHRFHYTDFQKGFDAMENGEASKVILDWSV